MPLSVIPSDWMTQSDDFEARLMRAGIHGAPVLKHPPADAWSDGSAPTLPDLFAKLLAHKKLGAELARVLDDATERNKRTPLARALMCNASTPYQATPEQALTMLAALLSRAVDHDPTRPISVDVLRQIGPEGAALAQELHGVIGDDARASDAEIAAAAKSVQHLAMYREQGPIARALISRAPQTPAAPTVASPAPATDLQPASARLLAERAAKRIPVPTLLATFGYGAEPALVIARASLKDGGLLGRWLAQHGVKDDAAIAATIIKLVTGARGTNGEWEGFLRATGAEGAKVVEALIAGRELGQPTRPNYPFLAKIVDALRTTMPEKEGRTLIKELVQKGGLLPTSVPVVDRCLAEIPANHFAGRGLCAVQHLFPTTPSIIEALIKRGMDPKHIFILGTPYATNPLVASYLRALGVNVMTPTDALGNSRAFEEHRVKELEQFLGRVVVERNKPTKGFLVLDDGGMLATTIAGQKSLPGGALSPERLEKAFPPERTVTIEQTTRGLTELKKSPLRYPVITVANAPAKREEGTIIGWSLARSFIADLKQRGCTGKRIGLISAGTVGLATARVLKDAGYTVTLTDLDEKKLEAARAAGFATTKSTSALLPNADALLACTGKASISADVLQQWPGILASGSSAAIEFDSTLLDSARRTPVDIVNLGRPINFKGDGYEDLSPAQIGVTRGILLGALAQAATLAEKGTTAPEFIPLDARIDDIVSRYWLQNGGCALPPLTERNTMSTIRRPDAQGAGASHDEWMSYLSSLERRVEPSPFDVRFRAGLYFFTDDDGKTRWVDTSGAGLSRPSTLQQVPERVFACDDARSVWLVEYTKEKQRYVAGIDLATNTLKAPAAVDAFAAARAEATYGTNLKGTSLLWTAGSDVVFTFQRSNEAHRMAAGIRPSDLVRRIDFETCAVITPSPPDVRLHCLFGEGASSVWSRAMKSYRVPREIAKIEAFVDDPSSTYKAIVGRSAKGELLFSLFEAGPLGQRAHRLPAGAVFRGFHRPDPARPFEVAVDYTLAGEAAELETIRSVMLDFRENGGGFVL